MAKVSLFSKATSTFSLHVWLNIALVIIVSLALFPGNLHAREVGLELRDAYAMALDTNNNIRIAAEELEQARLLKKQAITVLFPKLTATAGASKLYYDDGSTLENTTWGFNLNQTVYNGGRVWIAKKGADYTFDAAEYGVEFAKESVLMDLVAKSYQVLAAEELLLLEDKRIDRVKEQLRSSQAKFEVGQASKTDVLSARVALSAAQRDRVEAEKELSLAKRRLALLIGADGPVRVALPPDVDLKESGLDEYREIARQNRPDLLQSAEMTRISRQEARLVKASGNPNLKLSASYSHYSDQAPFVPEKQVALNFEWPFFQGGLVRLQTKEAMSRVRQAEESHDRLLKASDLEVEEAYRELLALNSQKELVKSSLESARENYRLARIQFDLGAATDLDVLTAQDGLAESENMSVNHKYKSRIARAALLYSIGALDLGVFNFE